MLYYCGVGDVKGVQWTPDSEAENSGRQGGGTEDCHVHLLGVLSFLLNFQFLVAVGHFHRTHRNPAAH